MESSPLWIQLAEALELYRRNGEPVIGRTPEGDLAVNGEPVIERVSLTCGLIVLATASGVAVINRELLPPWANQLAQGLARDLQA